MSNMDNSKPIIAPLVPHFKLSYDLLPHSEEEREQMSHVPYSSAVGSLMYTTICTRTDLAYVVSAITHKRVYEYSKKGTLASN